jgi:aspartate/methionine/tyrosine aminotransferase
MARGLAATAVAARRSGIRVVFDAAQGRTDLLRLEIGEPSFATPAHIVAAANAAALEGHTGYGPNGGLLSLRHRLADKLRSVNGYAVEPEQIVVTPGGVNAIYSAYLAILEPGDEVLIPSPGFPNMDQMVRLFGGVPVVYGLERAANYDPDLASLEALVTPRTRVLFINTPSNPTGRVLPGEVVESLVAFARRHDLWLLSDEVYDELVLDDDREHVSAARFDTDERVISVYSFSKVYAMTGWRVGYAAAPRAVADILRKLQEPQVSCPSTISQKAAEAALVGPREPIDAMRRAYADRRDLAWEAVAAAGLTSYRTEGGLYMAIDIEATGASSMEFALRLIDEEGVTVAPGSVFGTAAEGMIRVSVASQPEAIGEGIRRIGAAVQRWSAQRNGRP